MDPLWGKAIYNDLVNVIWFSELSKKPPERKNAPPSKEQEMKETKSNDNSFIEKLYTALLMKSIKQKDFSASAKILLEAGTQKIVFDLSPVASPNLFKQIAETFKNRAEPSDSERDVITHYKNHVQQIIQQKLNSSLVTSPQQTTSQHQSGANSNNNTNTNSTSTPQPPKPK